MRALQAELLGHPGKCLGERLRAGLPDVPAGARRTLVRVPVEQRRAVPTAVAVADTGKHGLVLAVV
ncbi:hypothetical protein GCM10010193_39800 [Kitasatospora atroaurantiaca]|uniref:hypothetical protein n=1 Tax=Kitasatospora atroaurantiaca TaxID=285545 RepID=UPI0011A38619|nr:hypothetical protein [Kitasatospora atroaurantiaca]